MEWYTLLQEDRQQQHQSGSQPAKPSRAGSEQNEKKNRIR